MTWVLLTGAGLILLSMFVFFHVGNPLWYFRKRTEAREAGIEAGRKARLVGRVRAVRDIEAQHAKTIRTFNYNQHEKLDRLRDNPAALARWLTKLSE